MHSEIQFHEGGIMGKGYTPICIDREQRSKEGISYMLCH